MDEYKFKVVAIKGDEMLQVLMNDEQLQLLEMF